MLPSLSSPSSSSASHTPPPPAQLWVGEHDALITHTTSYLQRHFCPQHGCAVCTVCRQIADHQHHAIMWLIPENRYTLEQLEPVMRTMSFALNHQELFFFIIQHADLLSPICANSLLKSLEEPPPGYCFILLSQRPDTLLPTVRSRCITQSFFESSETISHPLLAYFMGNKTDDPLAFLQELQAHTMSEQQILALLDTLLHYWQEQHKNAILDNNAALYKKAAAFLGVIHKALELPPMPGSSTLFLKQLFLQFHCEPHNSAK